MMKKYNGIISGVYELLSSLSHIGETSGIDSYLNTQQIINNGAVEDVFVYSGNAIRGALRDAAATFLLTQGDAEKKVSNDLFQLLFSGGNISGEQKTDIGKFIKIREDIPMVSVFGGGIGSSILSGKICVSDGYPLCEEAINILPKEYEKECTLSWKKLTGERSYTRQDDSKNVLKNEFMSEQKEDKKKKGEASTQMRYTVETLNAGAKIWQMIQLNDLTEIELGCLVSAIYEMSKLPYLGGKKNIGMGRYKLNYKYQSKDFISLEKDGNIILSELTESALSTYKEHIKTIDIESVVL